MKEKDKKPMNLVDFIIAELMADEAIKNIEKDAKPYANAFNYPSVTHSKELCNVRNKEDKEDNVNHPKHYTAGKYECIDVIEDVTKNLKGFEAYLVGNIIKYIWRYKIKNGAEDLKKARFYLNKLIDQIANE